MALTTTFILRGSFAVLFGCCDAQQRALQIAPMNVSNGRTQPELWSFTAVLPKFPHCNCPKRVPNRPPRPRRGRFGRLLELLQCGILGRTAESLFMTVEQTRNVGGGVSLQQATKLGAPRHLLWVKQGRRACFCCQKMTLSWSPSFTAACMSDIQEALTATYLLSARCFC